MASDDIYIYICVGCTFELLDLLPQTRRLIWASLEEQSMLQKVQQKNCFKKLRTRYRFSGEFEARWQRWHAVSREFGARWQTWHSADRMVANEITWVFQLYSMIKWSHSQCCICKVLPTYDDVKMLPHYQMYTLVFLNNDVSLDLQPSVMPFHFPSTIDIMLDISSIIDLYVFQQLDHIMPYCHKGFSSFI